MNGLRLFNRITNIRLKIINHGGRNMLKTTLLGILTTAMLSAISIGTETLFPPNPAKDQGTVENNAVSSTESASPYTDTTENIICDYCLSNASEHGHGHHYIDANGDGICDNYTAASGSESSSGTDCPAGYGTDCPAGYDADCPSGYDTETHPHNNHHNKGHENGHHK